MVRPRVRGGRGAPHLGSSIIRRASAGRDFLPRPPATGGREESDRPAVLQGPKGRGEACEVRWRGAHQALAQTSSLEARHSGVLGRLRSSWRRSAAICWGPDAPHSLAGPDAHAQAIGMREARRTVPSLPSERHRSPMHTTARRADSSVGGVHPRDERSRRLDVSQPHFPLSAFFSGAMHIEATRLRNLHREQISSTRSEEHPE